MRTNNITTIMIDNSVRFIFSICSVPRMKKQTMEEDFVIGHGNEVLEESSKM